MAIWTHRRARPTIMAFCKMNGLWLSPLEAERIPLWFIEPPCDRAVAVRVLVRKMLGWRKNTEIYIRQLGARQSEKTRALFSTLTFAVPLYSLGMHYRRNKPPADIYARLLRYPTWGMLIRARKLHPGTTANVLTCERHEGNDRRDSAGSSGDLLYGIITAHWRDDNISRGRRFTGERNWTM